MWRWRVRRGHGSRICRHAGCGRYADGLGRAATVGRVEPLARSVLLAVPVYESGDVIQSFGWTVESQQGTTAQQGIRSGYRILVDCCPTGSRVLCRHRPTTPMICPVTMEWLNEFDFWPSGKKQSQPRRWAVGQETTYVRADPSALYLRTYKRRPSALQARIRMFCLRVPSLSSGISVAGRPMARFKPA